MDVKICSVLFLVMVPVIIDAWRNSGEDRRNFPETRRGVHYHTKRHMLPQQQGPEQRRRTTLRPRDGRKKPSGHLTPIEEDDMDNEIVSVAIGPPPIRPKYDRIWRHPSKPSNNSSNYSATVLVKDVLTQLGREFLTHQVNENFVFGQYVGNTMKNLTSELRLKMQHEILELIVKYQKFNRGETIRTDDKSTPTGKEVKLEKKHGFNETDDGWPDFSNLAKIVG